MGVWILHPCMLEGFIMFMLSLMQPSGLYELEKDSLEAISAQLLQMIQMKSYHLYTHYVGLLMIPNAMIQKAPYLNKQEMSKYKQHAASGANMIENYPCCQQILSYIRYHHEKWDGSGYPKHLRGPNIPLGARIIAVADYYDSTVNPSTEFWAKTKAKAKEELFSASGSLFDPDVVKAFRLNLTSIRR